MFWLIHCVFLFFGGWAVLVGIVGGYMIYLQPSFYFPKPTGQYQVGTTTFHVDPSNGIRTEKPQGLMVQLWYPAPRLARAKIPPVPYAPYLVDYFKNNYFGTWCALYARPLYSFAQPNAPLYKEADPFPVILFSHGSNWSRNNNTANCEELASHGYVVVGVSHTSRCIAVQYPGYPPIGHSITQELSTLISDPMRYLQEEHNGITIWVNDLTMVLDELERLVQTQSSKFYAQLDMNRIGIFGHTYGGAAAAQLCRHDARIKAGFAMAPMLQGKDRMKGFSKPFMFLLSDHSDYEGEARLLTKMGMSEQNLNKFIKTIKQTHLPEINRLTRNISHHAYIAKVFRTGHMDFCDYTLIKEASLVRADVRREIFLGKLNGYEVNTIANNLLVGFFDEYLKGKEGALASAYDDHKFDLVMQHFSSGREIAD